jgi:hypothetical protein
VTWTITGESPSGMYSAYLMSRPCSLTGFRSAENAPISELFSAPEEIDAPFVPPMTAASAV